MQGEVAPYKLAWLEGGRLHSSMHQSLAEAKAAMRNVPILMQ